MKRGNGSKIVRAGATFLGVDLGADYTAEHEGGIAGIEAAFGVSKKAAPGIARHVAHLAPKFFWDPLTLTIAFERLGYPALTSTYLDGVLRPYSAKRRQGIAASPKDFEGGDVEITGAWDENSFGVRFAPRFAAEAAALAAAIGRHDLAFLFGNVGDNPFARSGLNLVIASHLPKQILAGLKAGHVGADRLAAAAKATKIEARIRAVSEAERANRPYLSLGHGFYALSPGWAAGFKPAGRTLQTKHPVVFFLNPAQQDRYNFGWFTVEELEAWLKNTGPVVKSPGSSGR
jgi:hypothetical protein